MTAAVVWLVAAQTELERWAPLFALSAVLTVLLGLAPRRDAQPFAVAKPAPARKRVKLAQRHGPAWVKPCAYCLQPAEAWDHVVPWARGGSDDERNMAPACVDCNSSKGDQTPEEWWAKIGRGKPYPPHWPRSA